jgi:hypothetical protein
MLRSKRFLPKPNALSVLPVVIECQPPMFLDVLRDTLPAVCSPSNFYIWIEAIPGLIDILLFAERDAKLTQAAARGALSGDAVHHHILPKEKPLIVVTRSREVDFKQTRRLAIRVGLQ